VVTATGDVDLSSKTQVEVVSLLTNNGANPNVGSVSLAGLALTITTYDIRNLAARVTEAKRDFGGPATDIVRSRSYNAFGELATETDARAPRPPILTRPLASSRSRPCLP